MPVHPHRAAEELAIAAESAMRKGDRAAARALYASAAEREVEAVGMTPRDKPRTYSILAVSVVALQYKARLFDAAEKSAFRFMGEEHLTGRARDQLRDLIETIWDERALLIGSGLVYSGHEIEVALRGGMVGAGTAPLALAIHVQTVVSSFVTRIAEFIGKFDFRERGPAPRQLWDGLQLRATTGSPGSYKFTIKFAEPDQLEMFQDRRVDVRGLSETVMKFIDAAIGEGTQDVEDVVPPPDYRLATLQLLRNIAPAGKSFSEVDFVQRGNGAEARVQRLGHDSRRRINERVQAERGGDKTGTLVGVLRGLHLDRNWLEIVADDGTSHRCKTPKDMLDDVVGPWVNQRVIVSGRWESTRKGRKFFAADVEPSDAYG